MDVPYDCLACGACCLHAGGVLLLDQDVARLAAHLGLSEDQVRIRYTHDGEHLRTKGRDDPACVFLDWQRQLAGGTRCTVYEARPQVCRDYPVGGAACLRERKNIGLPTVPQPPGQTPST
ncbi:MAG: YkgJ family cysteine cluster protein [Planctomycetota bacterium]